MPASEITQWQAYERVAGPLGGERDDVLAAMSAYYVVTALGAKRARIEKMLPRWDRPAQDWRQIQQVFMALTVASGGSVN